MFTKLVSVARRLRVEGARVFQWRLRTLLLLFVGLAFFSIAWSRHLANVRATDRLRKQGVHVGGRMPPSWLTPICAITGWPFSGSASHVHLVFVDSNSRYEDIEQIAADLGRISYLPFLTVEGDYLTDEILDKIFRSRINVRTVQVVGANVTSAGFRNLPRSAIEYLGIQGTRAGSDLLPLIQQCAGLKVFSSTNNAINGGLDVLGAYSTTESITIHEGDLPEEEWLKLTTPRDLKKLVIATSPLSSVAMNEIRKRCAPTVVEFMVVTP